MKQSPFTFSPDQRIRAVELFRLWFDRKSYGLAAIAVGGAHTHLLCQLPPGRESATLGWAKKFVSQRMTESDPSIPSNLFAARGNPGIVRTPAHFKQAYHYVVEKHAAEGAVVWGWDAGRLKDLAL